MLSTPPKPPTIREARRYLERLASLTCDVPVWAEYRAALAVAVAAKVAK